MRNTKGSKTNFGLVRNPIFRPKSKNKQSFTFKTFEEANAFAKLKDGQVYKEKNSWKVRIKRSVK